MKLFHMNRPILKNLRQARRAMAETTIKAIDLSADIGPDHTITALMFAAAQVAREADHSRREMELWCDQAMTFYEIGKPSE
jgi:hypothetical protein